MHFPFLAAAVEIRGEAESGRSSLGGHGAAEDSEEGQRLHKPVVIGDLIIHLPKKIVEYL